MFPFQEKRGAVCQDRGQNRFSVGRRRPNAPFHAAGERGGGALQEIDPDLPLSTPADMDVGRRVIRRIEPELHPGELKGSDFAQYALLCNVNPRIKHTGQMRKHG